MYINFQDRTARYFHSLYSIPSKYNITKITIYILFSYSILLFVIIAL